MGRLRAKFHLPGSNGSLYIAIKWETELRFHTAAILWSYIKKSPRTKLHIFFTTVIDNLCINSGPPDEVPLLSFPPQEFVRPSRYYTNCRKFGKRRGLDDLRRQNVRINFRKKKSVNNFKGTDIVTS
jgi:hypothetical protein